MLVTRRLFKEVIKNLEKTNTYSLDTETTSLYAYKDGQLFSIIIADEYGEYYFNFQSYPDMEEDQILPREWLSLFSPVFGNSSSVWFIHNAKFDLSMLAREGLRIAGTIHCTQAIARVEYNAHLKYSLDECARRINLNKSDVVEEYISKYKKYKMEKIPGRKQLFKNKKFHLVPLEIIQPYAEQDARVTYLLGKHQIKAIQEMSEKLHSFQKPLAVTENERKFTKTCFEIEQRGILIDKDYCVEAAKHETENMAKAAEEFFCLTGKPLINSSKELSPIFKDLGEIFPQTEKGRDSFTKKVLDTFKTPAAEALKEYRKAEKRAAYFYSYLYHADKNGVIHADIKQSGTESGRVSYGNPNFQNVPKRGEDNSRYPVRRAITPRPGFTLFMFDYDQVEYRMMIDYSQEMHLIHRINNGLDIHVACQEMMGLDNREAAKTLNFMKLYGGGVKKLAESLGIGYLHARALSQRYWQRLPRVSAFIQKTVQAAELRGYVVNWFGRVCHFPVIKYAYAAPNHLIQGGCADVVKIAMNQIGGYLADKKSKMILQVHDEIVVEVHESEEFVVPEIKRIMESVYPYKALPLTCGVDYSSKSWFDKSEWTGDNGKKTGNFISPTCNEGVTNP